VWPEAESDSPTATARSTTTTPASAGAGGREASTAVTDAGNTGDAHAAVYDRLAAAPQLSDDELRVVLAAIQTLAVVAVVALYVQQEVQ
jgi:hypothetical protein